MTTSGAIALAYSAYDYATWDKYDGETKAAIVREKTGKHINYINEKNYNLTKAEALKNGAKPHLWGVYREMDGFTLDERSFITDGGLSSRNYSEITYTHEFSHKADNAANNKLGLPLWADEPKAYQAEAVKYYRYGTPSRYYSPNSGVKPWFGNKLINIFR